MSKENKITMFWSCFTLFNCGAMIGCLAAAIALGVVTFTLANVVWLTTGFLAAAVGSVLAGLELKQLKQLDKTMG